MANTASDFGQGALGRLLALPEAPTAVFAASDYLALGLLDGLRARGMNAPEQLSLVGFDDVSYAELTTPRLSTIRQPARLWGRTAWQTMFKLLNGATDVMAETRIPVEWVGRDSVRCRE